MLSAIRSARFPSVGCSKAKRSIALFCTKRTVNMEPAISKFTSGPVKAIQNSSPGLAGRSRRATPPIGNMTISIVRIPYRELTNACPELVQQHGSDQRQNEDGVVDGRLIAPESNDNQEDEKQDEGEVQTNRNTHQADGSNRAGARGSCRAARVCQTDLLQQLWHRRFSPVREKESFRPNSLFAVASVSGNASEWSRLKSRICATPLPPCAVHWAAPTLPYGRGSEGGLRLLNGLRNRDRKGAFFQRRISANNFLTPSTHSTAACFDSGISPPTSASTVSGWSDASSSRVFPCIHSVSADPLAIDAVHPRTLYRTSAILPFSKRAESRIISPHAGFEISTVTAGGARSPTLRGFLK